MNKEREALQKIATMLKGSRIADIATEALQSESESEWVSVEDKKPTRADADENGYLDCAFWNNSKMQYYRGSALWFTIASSEEGDMTMWIKTIPLPQAPKTPKI